VSRAECGLAGSPAAPSPAATPVASTPQTPTAAAAAAAAASAASVQAGVLYGVAAYLAWGFVALYFKAVAHVVPLEVLAHRIVWSLALLAVVLTAQGRWGAAWRATRSRPVLLALGGSTLLIAFNWLVFIWCVAGGRVLEASLGYYINPLVNILLGFVFLGERLRRMQLVAVALAFVGVAYLTVQFGSLPWLGLALAFSFGFYGLLRKVAPVDAFTGLTVETSLLAPLALGYLLCLGASGSGVFGVVSRGQDALLAASGLVTAIPLLCFAAAARRLRLSTVGFLQYIAPTGQFLLAVIAFGEPFGRAHWISFGCIWTALAIYTTDALLRRPAASQPRYS